MRKIINFLKAFFWWFVRFIIIGQIFVIFSQVTNSEVHDSFYYLAMVLAVMLRPGLKARSQKYWSFFVMLSNTVQIRTRLGWMVRQLCAVLTNSHFTGGAKELAARTGTLLWDREKIISMLGPT